MSNPPPIAPEDEAALAAAAEKEHTRPPSVFKGQELAMSSRGTRRLYHQVCDDGDLVIYRVLAFIYIHLHPRAEMIRLCWDINAFREKLFEFMDTLSDEDEAEAQRIFNEIHEAEASTAVKPQKGSLAGGTQKKTKDRNHRTPPTSKSSSAPSSD